MQLFSAIPQMISRHIPVLIINNKLDGVALLVACPPRASSTTDTDRRPLSDIGDPRQYFQTMRFMYTYFNVYTISHGNLNMVWYLTSAYFKKILEEDHNLEWHSNKTVCRTALAKPGLINFCSTLYPNPRAWWFKLV